MVDVDYVFDDEGMELEEVSEVSQGGFGSEADDIDPESIARGGNCIEFIDIGDFFFDIVVPQSYDMNFGGDGRWIDEDLSWSIPWFCASPPVALLLFVVSFSRHFVDICWLVVVLFGGCGWSVRCREGYTRWIFSVPIPRLGVLIRTSEYLSHPFRGGSEAMVRSLSF